MAKLTKAAVERAFKAKVSCTIWCGDLKGFAFRVSPKGKGSWLIKRRLGEGGRNAKQILFAFGSYPDMKFDDAYNEALKLVAAISEGINPQNEKRKLKNKQHEAYANGKLKQVYEQWYEKHRSDDWETPGSYWYEVGRRFNVEVLPKLGEQTLVADVTKSCITNLIDNKERVTQSGAKQVFNCIRPFFKWCASRELIPFDPMDGLKPPEPSEARDRVLSPDELAKVWEASSLTAYPFGPVYKLLLLTLQRRDEVAGMRWCELDHRTKEWVIPGSRTKNGKEHLVHLSPQAWEVIDAVACKAPRIAEGRFASQYVFTTTLETSVSGFSKAKATLDETIKELFEQGIEPWRLHDLRRTGATGMAMLGVPPHIVERVLNHISAKDVGGLTGIYQRFQYVEERKAALLSWSRYVDSLASETATSLEATPVLALPAP